MIGKKINQLATELAPDSTDLTIIGDPISGVSKKITLAQLGAIFSGAVSFYTNLAAFPVTGDINVIYCAKDTQKLYLWSGSAYVEVFPSQALLNTYQLRSEKGVSNGYASLDSAGKVPIAQLPSSIMEYKGTWNAATNTPTLANGTGDTGDVYICNVAGTVNFGAGAITFAVGDYVIYSGTIWQRSSGAVGTVTSVAASITGDAIGITGSPITTSGTLALAFAGTSAQYINGAGILTTFPTSLISGSGASGQVTFFNGANSVTGTNNFFWDATNNRLGIGTTTPQRSIEIYNTTADNHLRLSGNAPSVSMGEAVTGSVYQAKFGLVTTNGQFVSAGVAGDFVIISQTGATIIGTSSTEKMRVNTSGNVSINNTNNTYKLDVTGTGRYTGQLRLESTITDGTNTYTLPSATGTLALTSQIPSVTGYVPYTGATANLDLGTHTLIAAKGPFSSSGSSDTVGITHSSGSGIALNITKGGSGEGLYINKTSGSGNAATIIGTLNATTLVKSGGTSSQFLKADGSVDSTSYGTGSVTSVGLSSATSGVTIGSTPITTSGTITLAIATASGSAQGLLSSTDWTTFNNKQNALTNPVTGTGTTNYLPKFTGTSTIGNSVITDDGTNVTINGSAATSKLKIVNPLSGSLFQSGIEFIRTTVSGGSKIEAFRDAAIGGVGLSFQVTANNTAEVNATYTNALQILNTGAATFSSSVTATSFNGTTNNIFSVSGTEGMRLTSTGLGIGTTAPAYPLQVRRAGGGGSLGISIDGVGSTDRTVQYFAIQDSASGVGSGHAFYYRAPSSTTDTLGLILDESGRVGIGTGTSGSGRLNILNISANPFLELRSINNIYQVAKITFDENTDKMTIMNNQSYSLSGIAFGTNGTERMFLNVSGNLGIGTSSPNVASGLGLVLNGQAGQTRLAFKNNYTGDTSTDGVQFALIGGSSAFVFQNREADGYFSFETNGNEAMRITSGGSVGIGTTSPTTNLQVYQTGGAGNNYVEGTIQVGGVNSALGGAFSYAAQSSGFVNITNLNNGGGANARISFGFGAITSGLPANNVMTINQSGNVGINKTNPGSKLSIVGLPTSSAGLTSGDIYVSAGVLMIV